VNKFRYLKWINSWIIMVRDRLMIPLVVLWFSSLLASVAVTFSAVFPLWFVDFDSNSVLLTIISVSMYFREYIGQEMVEILLCRLLDLNIFLDTPLYHVVCTIEFFFHHDVITILRSSGIALFHLHFLLCCLLSSRAYSVICAFISTSDICIPVLPACWLSITPKQVQWTITSILSSLQ